MSQPDLSVLDADNSAWMEDMDTYKQINMCLYPRRKIDLDTVGLHVLNLTSIKIWRQEINTLSQGSFTKCCRSLSLTDSLFSSYHFASQSQWTNFHLPCQVKNCSAQDCSRKQIQKIHYLHFFAFKQKNQVIF